MMLVHYAWCFLTGHVADPATHAEIFLGWKSLSYSFHQLETVVPVAFQGRWLIILPGGLTIAWEP